MRIKSFALGWKTLRKGSSTLACFSFLLCMFVGGLYAFSQAQAPPKETRKGIVPGQYIVVLHDYVQDPAAVAKRMARFHRFSLRHVYKRALKGFSATIPDVISRAVARDPDVAFVEPDRMVYAIDQDIPTGVMRVGADQNRIANIDGSDDRVDVDIAIIDTGIDLDHPDLNVFSCTDCARLWGNGCRDGKGNDGHGHGTHVAGIAAALDNDIGVVGVAPGARLWAVRVLDNRGSGYLSWVINGIDWVTAHANQIEVANMSLGWQGYSRAAHQAIQESVSRGVVYVAAAGNDSMDVFGPDGMFGTGDDFCPASFPEVATISALCDTDGISAVEGPSSSYGGSDRNDDGVDDGRDDSFAWFSNFSASVEEGNPVDSPGNAIDLLCPGVDIYSTYKNGGYTTFSGTSMASPHASGLVALYIAETSGRATDAGEVYDIRQALIDRGIDQTDLQGLAVQNDPDENPERLGWAGDTGPTTDIAITAVEAEPNPVIKGEEIKIKVTVKNVGSEDAGTLNVTLDDETDGKPIGGETIDDLAAGASEIVTFLWDTADVPIGDHTLTAYLEFSEDENSTNNSKSTIIEVRDTAIPTTMHIGDLDGTSANLFWGIWVATVTITVHDATHDPVANTTVYGTFSDGPTVFECTTDGSGRCSVEGWQWWLDCLTFTVSDVLHDTLLYDSTNNHDPDGDSNGTGIEVCRP